ELAPGSQWKVFPDAESLCPAVGADRAAMGATLSRAGGVKTLALALGPMVARAGGPHSTCTRASCAACGTIARPMTGVRGHEGIGTAQEHWYPLPFNAARR